ncbi:MAG: hypothetical protein L6Q98_02400 [Anaerolineae bacterium]|nr:hypothetical protein [Anaerolineae bacterium]NUQ02927.1 hypothetical protein [Anaerolineae bacterium]
MRTRFTRLILCILAAALLALAAGGAAAQTDDLKANAIILIVANSDLFADWLPNYPDYQVNASGPDEDGNWYIEFHDSAWEEWLGYAVINETSGEIVDSFAPKPLPADVYQQQLERVTQKIMNDPEVLGWLDNQPELWDTYIDFNRWDRVWQAWFSRGIIGVVVSAGVDEQNGSVWISDISDPNALDEEDALNDARSSAINLAYSAPGIDVALEGHDRWMSYAEWQYDQVWSVTFAADDTRLFYALVDLAEEEVLDSSVG